MVIFLDIDGTLSKGKNHVSALVKEGIEQARKNKHQVILCTGRNRMDIEEIMKIGFDGAICSGGGWIELDGKIISHDCLNQEAVLEAIKLFQENQILYKLECNWMSFQDDMMLEMFNRFGDDLEGFKQKHHIFNLEQYQQEEIQTIYFFGKKEALENAKEQLENQFAFYIYGKIPNGYYEGEVMNPRINKGQAILKVMEHLNQPIHQSIGFGDSMNDLSMIQAVQFGIVMENGSDELKKYASSICESVNNDGIYYELKRRGII